MLFGRPYIGKCFELYGQYSEEEERTIRTFVTPGSTAIDVGANIGDLTLPMALFAGEAGCVYAFESHIDTYNVLCANLALNGVSNTLPFNAFVAASDQADTSSTMWGPHAFVSEKWRPPFKPIDSLDLDAGSFIKVDGNELDVLRSAEGTLARTRPVLYVEIDAREKSPALLEYLLAAEYAVFWHKPPIFEADNFFGNPVNH